MKRKVIFLVLAILWMVVIFSMSAKNADDSTKASHRVGRLIGRIFVPNFEEKSEAVQEEYAQSIDFYVRKTAHAMEYAVLAFLLAGAVTVPGGFKKNRLYLAISYAITVIYAGTDEVHQLYVPGRDGKITDVLIDSGGGIVGLLFFAIIFYIFARRNKKNSLPVENE